MRGHLVIVSWLLGAVLTQAAPILNPKTSATPTPEATKLIEERRKRLQEHQVGSRDRLTPAERADFDQKTAAQIADLTAALAHDDPHVYSEAVRDLTNSEYRSYDTTVLLNLLKPRLNTVETHSKRLEAQAWVIRYLARPAHHDLVRDCLPALLRFVTNEEVSEYVRGTAIEASAAIGGGDEAVLKAFTQTLARPERPNAQSVKADVLEQLTRLGPKASRAQEALVKLYRTEPRYQSRAFTTLGSVARDVPARPAKDYLHQLERLDQLDLTTAAKTFWHLGGAVRTGRRVWVGKPAQEVDELVPDVVQAARPLLLAIVDRRPSVEHTRASLATLNIIGPGSSATTVKLLTTRILESHVALETARQALHQTPVGPERVAKNQAFYRAQLDNLRDDYLYVLLKSTPSDPAAVGPLHDAFRQLTPSPNDWSLAEPLAKLLTRYGTAAAPAVPDTLRAMRALPLTPTLSAFYDVFQTYLALLAGVGHTDPAVGRALNEFLDPAGDLRKKCGIGWPRLQLYLLLAWAHMGQPTDKTVRAIRLERLGDGLASEHAAVYSAAAKIVLGAKDWTDAEANVLVPRLTRALTDPKAFNVFPAESPRELTWPFASQEIPLLGGGFALRALASLGPRARAALPVINTLAEQPFAERTSDFVPEPSINVLIREARQAKKLIDR